MANRRNFIRTGMALAAGTIISPSLVSEALATSPRTGDHKLRFLLASDGHYGQPGTEFERTHADLIQWINAEHQAQKIDFAIINGDLVHDRPELLKVVNEKYFRHLEMPYYTIPGNHDHATNEVWNEVFGYDFNYSFEKGDTAFILANTSNEKGVYLCPDIRFLQKELDKYRSLTSVFIVLHIPPHQWLKEDPFINCDDVITLFHSHPNVRALFHGHDHSLDGVRYTDKLPHFFDGHYGGSWGTEYMGFRIVEIGLDNNISTWQKNPGLQPIINKTSLKAPASY